jgi:integrase
MLLLVRWTGLRGVDAVKLTWAEIDSYRKEIERITQKRKKKVIVAIHPELLFALETEYERRRPELSDVLLNPNTGTVMTRPRLYQRMVALGRRAGVPNTHPHRFRDTLAVDMLETTELRERVRKILENGEGLEKDLDTFWTLAQRQREGKLINIRSKRLTTKK